MSLSSSAVVKVLLIEDNPGDVRLLREALRESMRQFDISDVANLNDGLQALDEDAFDVVLLDLSLPDSTGLGTFDALHLNRPNVPVVVLSGTSDELVAMEAVHRGAQDYLVKGQADGPVLARAMLYAIERQRSEEALRESENRYRSIVYTANEGVAMLDPGGRLEFANPRLCEMLGYEQNELRGALFEGFVDEQHRAAWRDQFALIQSGRNGRSQYDLRLRNRAGSGVWVLISASAQTDTHGRVLRSLLMANDVTQRKLAEEALEHQALHDALTGLPNRTLLHDRLEHAIYFSQRNEQCLALLLMDLNGFKEVNDAFGHQFGDMLLAQIGLRLEKVLRRSDTVARLGGDEFAFLLPDVGQEDVARVLAIQLAAKISDAMSPPFVVEGQSVEIAGSIGIALFPEHGLDWQTLMRRADSAMYAAKSRHSAFEVFADDLDEDAAARLTLLADLRRALTTSELEVYYQPKLDARTGVCRCVEALVRWHHPRDGLMLPGRFVGLAEQSGLIRPLALRVLEQALRQCHAWREDGLEVAVAVNLSMRNLHDTALPAHIRELLDRIGLDASCLIVEVTESSIMADATRAMDVMGMLAEMGVGLSIDDFGTGYSSLAYLKRLPVTELKIDRSFVQHMAIDENDAAIVRSTIELGHNLGLRVVAEGVDSAEASERLADLGCDEAQGFYLAEPMPASECQAWLRARELLRLG